MAKAKKKSLKNSYWKDVAIRAVRTGVQVFAGVLMANQAGMFEADVLMAGYNCWSISPCCCNPKRTGRRTI